jgi:ATP-dependent 26S proteasome regulatory subunit
MRNSFIDILESSKNYVTRTLLFNQFKTGDPIIDTFLTTFILGIFSWLVNWIYDTQLHSLLTNFSEDDIKSFFFKKNTIIIEGRRSAIINAYSYSQNISASYSDRFKAVWNHIVKNIENNKTIYKIKESHSNYQSSVSINNEDRRKVSDIFMVYQNKHFLIDDLIYAKAEVEHESDKDDKEKTTVRTDKIILYIYSYKYSMVELIEYIDKITEKYLASIKHNRANKRFIYSLNKVEIKEQDSRFDCWREDIFESARTFDNIFFDGKKELINKIDFFIHNKNWYFEKGIPYSLGIGLHGPPGTGKTSFIKALANYTNRHIIILSLKLIKTKTQLENLFFENTYNDDNEDNSISWNKKILVFEDIDCIGDIIMNREEKEKKNSKKSNKNHQKKISQNDDSVKVGDIIQTICDINDKNITTSSVKENEITLDDILNLWDGIRETPGRILIISSNHYDKLDPALVRPGRIDITHELSNTSHNTISEIYLHLFGNKIDKTKLEKVKENFYSPAELINIYVSNKNENDFMNRLLKNKKVL